MEGRERHRVAARAGPSFDASARAEGRLFVSEMSRELTLGADAGAPRYYTLPGYTALQSRHIYDELLKLLCSPGHIGDMFQATSSNDITFWVLHPTVDRLWHYKRLGNTGDYDDTWDPYHTCYGLSLIHI